MSTDNYAQVLFNDGEGVDYGDLNNVTRLLESKLWDQVMQAMIGSIAVGSNADPQFGGQNGADAPTTRCYCLSPGSAYLRLGSANNKVQVAPGTLIQKIAAATGSDPKMLAYTFAGTEEWTISNGSGTTQRRVDLLQMTLAYTEGGSETRDFEDASTRLVTSTSVNKRRRVECTLSVKQGTPGTVPTTPEPDAGTVVVGSVYVGENYAGGAILIGDENSYTSSSAVLHDQRMPLSIRAYRVDPTQYKLITAATLNTTDANSSVSVTSSTNEIIVPCPTVSNGRLIAVGITKNDKAVAAGLTGLSVGISRGMSGTAANYTARNNLTTTIVASTDVDEIIPFTTFEASSAFSNPPGQSATTKIGSPLWTNGRRSPYEPQRLLALASRAPEHLCLRIKNTAFSAGSAWIGPITFYIAEGL